MQVPDFDVIKMGVSVDCNDDREPISTACYLR
jgi:hypothetical protein